MPPFPASPRARRDVELVGPVAPASRIEAEVESSGRRMELIIALAVDGVRAHRTIEVDGPRPRAVDPPGHLRVPLFWPDAPRLVKTRPHHPPPFLSPPPPHPA